MIMLKLALIIRYPSPERSKKLYIEETVVSEITAKDSNGCMVPSKFVNGYHDGSILSDPGVPTAPWNHPYFSVIGEIL